MATGVTFGKHYRGGARWLICFSGFGPLRNAKNGSKHVRTHHGTFQMLEVVDYGWR
jgi:hypothetical protein